MSLDKVMDVVGFIGGFFSSGEMVPQIVHMVRNRSARDFSWYMLGMFTLGQVLWIVHGGINKDPAVLTFASFNFLINVAFTIIKVSTAEELQHSSSGFIRLFQFRCLQPSLPLSFTQMT